MRHTEYFNQPAPELGDFADITVVTDALLAGEKNQSGKIEFLKATISGNVISLTSTSRTNKYTKHYDGMTVAFMSPSDINASDTSHTLKVDELAAQPFKIKTDIKRNDIVVASFNNTDGFITTNTPIPRSSATNSTSETTVATSKAVNDLRANMVNKQIIAGNGLTGGGNLNSNVTINVASADDSIIVSADNIKVNTYNGVDSTSTTKPASANAVKTAYDKANTAQNTANSKLDAGAVSADYNTGKKIEDKIKAVQKTADNKLDKGAYTGNAQNLKDEIDGKVSKNGDVMHGSLVIKHDANPYVRLELPTKQVGTFGYITDNVYLTNRISGHEIKLYNNGNSYFPAKNLKTYSKEVVEAINEEYKLLKGNGGLTNVQYIQDNITKELDNGYFDKVTGKLYRCHTSAPADVVTPNTAYFEPADNLDISSRIRNTFASFANNKLIEQKGITINSATYQGLDVTTQRAGLYCVIANGWAINGNNIKIYKNEVLIAQSQVASPGELPASVNAVVEANVGDSLRIEAKQNKYPTSPSFSIFRI